MFGNQKGIHLQVPWAQPNPLKIMFKQLLTFISSLDSSGHQW